ncbi:SGNH/GDSL hydrolase family protein, partial [Streptomyces sp. NPDC096080]
RTHGLSRSAAVPAGPRGPWALLKRRRRRRVREPEPEPSAQTPASDQASA